MKLRDLGEDRLVARLTRSLPTRPDVRVAAGDDCAVIGGKRDEWWQLLKTDAVVEGIHFEPGEDRARVGWKALCRAVSDVAAMGGLPAHALVTVAIEPGRDARELDALYRGLEKAARRFGVAIVGGETCRTTGPMMISVALTGRVERRCCVLRSGGKPGDAIWVTGTLGGSRAGKHLDFTPRLAEARWLVQNFRPHAMMDLSDGLGQDLPRLAQASGCGFGISREALPRAKGATAEQAIRDGEDFELLFTVRPGETAALARAWKRAFPRVRLTAIGHLQRHTSEPLPDGYDHFT